MPPEFKDLVKEEKTPIGRVRRYGPFVYGFSYTAEPGKEPVFQEFGNIKPSYRGIIVELLGTVTRDYLAIRSEIAIALENSCKIEKHQRVADMELCEVRWMQRRCVGQVCI